MTCTATSMCALAGSTSSGRDALVPMSLSYWWGVMVCLGIRLQRRRFVRAVDTFVVILVVLVFFIVDLALIVVYGCVMIVRR